MSRDIARQGGSKYVGPSHTREVKMPLYVSLIQEASGELKQISYFADTKDGALFPLRRHYPNAVIKTLDRVSESDESQFGRSPDDGRGVVLHDLSWERDGALEHFNLYGH
jgi:hypothetical protein